MYIQIEMDVHAYIQYTQDEDTVALQKEVMMAVRQEPLEGLLRKLARIEMWQCGGRKCAIIQGSL